MTSNLADLIDGTPGRFVPDEMRGELVEAEHLLRYWAAASLAPGRRVLDAGCGVGYGAALIAEHGARSVDAVDVAEAVVEAARARFEDAAGFAVADVRALPFPDDSFDLVVCFEVIEHIEEQPRAFAEFHRVLAPGGVLAVSSPNRDVYVPGNPHHVHEYLPAELEAELRACWSEVTLMRQHSFLATTLFSDEAVVAAEGASVQGANVRKLKGRQPGDEVYTVALASDRPLPAVRDTVVLTSMADVRGWLERFRDQQAVLSAQADTLADLAHSIADRDDLLARLAEAETALQERPAILAQLEASESAQQRLAEELEKLRPRARHADVIEASLSWRLTKPLRSVKQRLF